MSRRLPLLAAVLLATALLAYPFMPPRDAPAPAPIDLEPFVFGNRLPELNPPLEALAPAVLGDPVERALARLEWGRPEVFYWWSRHLPDDRERLARRILERFERIVVGSPLLAQRLIDALAVLAEPVAREPLIRIALAPPQDLDYLQVAAIRALARYPYDEEIRDALTTLSADPRSVIWHAAMQEVIKSEIFGDDDAVAACLEGVTDAEAVPMLQQVATRRLHGAAESCARFLASETLRARQTAILALLSIGDPRGAAAAEEELRLDDAGRVTMGLTLYRDAGVAPPHRIARDLADREEAGIRKQLAVALGAIDPGPEGEAGRALLRRLARDDDAYVRQTAVAELWKLGEPDAAAEWVATLREGHGAALREAIQFLCETLLDPRAAGLIRERLAKRGFDPTDHANLLGGLRHVGDASDVPLFVECMRRAGTLDDPRSTERTHLSAYAAIYVQAIQGALPILTDALPTMPTLRARLTLLDAIRGVARGAPAPDSQIAADRVFAILLDAGEPLEMRMAAADTIAFFDDPKLSERLHAARTAVADKALSDRIRLIWAAFF